MEKRCAICGRPALYRLTAKLGPSKETTFTERRDACAGHLEDVYAALRYSNASVDVRVYVDAREGEDED